MLKFENIAGVGDTIRAYDFEPFGDRPECFIEGEVVATIDQPHNVFLVRVIRDHWAGRDVQTRVGGEVLVPMQVSLFEYDTRVMNITEERK